jgi:hypothetical protein
MYLKKAYKKKQDIRKEIDISGSGSFFVIFASTNGK